MCLTPDGIDTVTKKKENKRLPKMNSCETIYQSFAGNVTNNSRGLPIAFGINSVFVFSGSLVLDMPQMKRKSLNYHRLAVHIRPVGNRSQECRPKSIVLCLQ